MDEQAGTQGRPAARTGGRCALATMRLGGGQETPPSPGGYSQPLPGTDTSDKEVRNVRG